MRIHPSGNSLSFLRSFEARWCRCEAAEDAAARSGDGGCAEDAPPAAVAAAARDAEVDLRKYTGCSGCFWIGTVHLAPHLSFSGTESF